MLWKLQTWIETAYQHKQLAMKMYCLKSSKPSPGRKWTNHNPCATSRMKLQIHWFQFDSVNTSHGWEALKQDQSKEDICIEFQSNKSKKKKKKRQLCLGWRSCGSTGDKSRTAIITEVRCRELNFQGSTIRSRSCFQVNFDEKGCQCGRFCQWV